MRHISKPRGGRQSAAAWLLVAASWGFASAGLPAFAGGTPPQEDLLTAAHAHLETALAKYDEGDFPGAEDEALAAGRIVYSEGATLNAKSRHFAEISSQLALLTVRLNRLLYEVSPELEPERFTLPVPYNARIEREIDRYLTTSREEFARWLRRSGRYLPTLRKYFRQEGLPEDLVYIALVESGFNPRNRSSKQAVGLFQFIQSTGEMVGLKNDYWIDERRDPDKATLAAIDHLKALYHEFGDWDLALAAYNAGSGRVWQAIRGQGTRDFWQLALPPETETYVPKFYAALVISREPELYGFSPVRETGLEYEEVEVPGGVDFKVIADCCGVTPTVISDLNTELTKGCTPPGDQPYPLRLPEGSAATFRDAYAALPENRKVLSDEELSRRKFKGVYVVYQVRPGDSLYTIARKHHTTIAKIQKWNPATRDKKYIYPRQKLRIYRVQ